MNPHARNRGRYVFFSTLIAFFIAWLSGTRSVEVLVLPRVTKLLFQTAAQVRAEPRATGAATGGLRGTVRIESRIQPRSMAISIYSRRSGSSAALPAPPPINEVENIVLYLEADFPDLPLSSSMSRAENANPLAARVVAHGHLHASIQQINETFVPHVLPIMAGTTVEFPNDDPFFHNVFSLSSAKSFDLGRYPQGQKRMVRFDKPGIVKVFCHIHSHMSAVILVLNHSYFTVPDNKGEFLFGPIPPGSYRLIGWHERLKPVRRPVTIVAGESLGVDLVL